MRQPDPHHDPTPTRLPGLDSSALRPMRLPEELCPLDEKLVALLRESKIESLTLALGFGDALLLVRGYGSGLPTRLQLLCSLGKPLTTQAVLLLVQEGKLRLDAPLKSLLPVSGAAGRITPRQLLTHQSGLASSHTELVGELQQRTELPRRQGVLFEYDLVCHALTKPLHFAPGEGFLYSSLGYQVLGRVIEAVSGLRADRFLQSKVLSPLGISRYVATSYLADADRVALSFVALPERLSTLSRTSWGCNDMAGAACMSALDYLRFVGSFRKQLSATTQKLLARPTTPGFGLGWQLREGIAQGKRVSGLSHTGIWTRETHRATAWSHGACSVCLIESADEQSCAKIHALVEEHCLALTEASPKVAWPSPAS